ncbi:hypothetical protein Tco_0799112 [Tanacetum coccineum]
MLAPSGEGLILYQAYGNLYAMTGRKAYLFEDKQIPSVGVFDKVFSTWMKFGGNTRELGSFGEETDAITDLHQILEEVLLTERGDGVAGIKRRRRDPSSDGVRSSDDSGRRPLMMILDHPRRTAEYHGELRLMLEKNGTEITDLHQILEEVLLTKRGDSVTGIKRRRRDPSSDGVRDLVTTSGRSRLNEDLESST